MKYSELLARQKEINALRDLIYSTINAHRKQCERGIEFPPNTLKSLYHALEIVDDMVMFEREYPIETVREYKTLVKHIHMMIQVKGGCKYA